MRPTRHAPFQDQMGNLGLATRDLRGLAPGGVCHAFDITVEAVVSYTTFSPFLDALARRHRDVCFL